MNTYKDIKRRVLLIGGFGQMDSRLFKDGVKSDIQNMKAHFLSPFGGAFREFAELRTAIQPTTEWVRNQLQWVKGAEYGVVYFSGHGNSQKGTAFIFLSDYDSVAVTELINLARRQITITDSCRNEVNPLSNFSGSDNQGLGELSYIDASFARNAFNWLVMKQPIGQILIQSSAYNQSSIGLENGGIFTNAFLGSIRAFIRREEFGLITTSVAFDRAKGKVITQTTSEQVATIKSSSDVSTLKFPIAIHPNVISKNIMRAPIKPKEDNSWKLLLGVVVVAIAVAVVASASDD